MQKGPIEYTITEDAVENYQMDGYNVQDINRHQRKHLNDENQDSGK